MIKKDNISTSHMFLRRIAVIVFIAVVISACSSISKSRTSNSYQNQNFAFPGYEELTQIEQKLADSIIGHALDHEALYSLMGDLKPISSIGFSLNYSFGKDSTHFDGQHNIVNVEDSKVQLELAQVKRWTHILEALSFDTYQFLLIPYKNVWNGERNMQILVCRKDLLDQLLHDKAPFFSQWGFVPGYDPAVILTTIEFEERNDRYRAYGYLFGYPRHAVDFFVDASIHRQKTKEFVKRDFFNIPVFKKKRGYFTYALPKDYKPTEKDSLIYNKASLILNKYKSIRSNYINERGKLDAIKLFRDWYKDSSTE